jgi:hypothetical protein
MPDGQESCALEYDYCDQGEAPNFCGVDAIHLSQIQPGPLTAWSIGQDNDLVGMDLATCQERSSTICLPYHQ